MGRIIRLTESDITRLVKRVISEQAEEGLLDLYKLFKYREDIGLILNEPNYDDRKKLGGILVKKLGGVAEAKKTVLGAIKSISYIPQFIKPLLPDDFLPALDLTQTKLFFSSMGFDEHTVGKATWAVSNICKQLGVDVIKLSESDITRLVRRVIIESSEMESKITNLRLNFQKTKNGSC